MAEAVQVANVDRSLRVLETLAGAPGGLSLRALADAAGLPKSAAHRLLHTLMLRGYVHQDKQSQDYCLSLKLALLGFRFLDARRLPDLLQGALDGLARASGEYCRIAIVEGEGLAWIARAQGARMGLRYDPPMGREVVLHATATGKAWLATLPEDEALRLVRARGLVTPEGFGANAVRSLDALATHLAQAREQGYAVAHEEGEPGIAAIARAFRTHDDPAAPAAGTVSIAGPLTRLTPARLAELVPLLVAATAELTSLWPVHRRQRSASPTPQSFA